MTVFNLTEIEKKAYHSTFQDGLWCFWSDSFTISPQV